MGKYFGTDGFRGEAGITLTADHADKVGRFLGWYYNALRERNGDTDPARIVIGKDTRRSSYMFEYSLVAGLTASGADAYGCRIGGEQSGHIIFSKYASTGDGILTSLKMMEVMLAKKKPMSELAAPLKIYPQVLENVRVTDKKAAQNDPAVQEAVNTVAEALGDTGRILVRESGTEPVVRVMVEAPDHDTCQKYVNEVVNVICEKGYKA